MNYIKAIKANDHRVFNQLYEQQHRQIYGFILQRTGSEYIAEEVTQLTFIKFWQQRDILSTQLDCSVQLFGMARQVMIDLLRKEATRFKYEGESASTPFTDSLISAIESKDILHIIEKDIEQMPKMRRMVFDLSRNQGFSHKEIADIFSITPKAVEQHIGRALLKLKEHLYSIML